MNIDLDHGELAVLDRALDIMAESMGEQKYPAVAEKILNALVNCPK